MTPPSPDTPRPLQHLRAVSRAYPGCWRFYDQLRADRGKGLPRWPDWVYCPLAGAYAVVSGGGAARVPPDRANQVGVVGALAAWRVGQGIYRIDPTLYRALVDTPVDGDLPHELLHHLPEWCVYIETPGIDYLGEPLAGAFVHLEWDANDGREELRLLLDLPRGLVPLPMHLGPWGLAESLRRMVAEAARQGQAAGLSLPPAGPADQALVAALEPLVSLVLYLCSAAADYGPQRPAMPRPTRTKEGWRLFPPDRPRVWEPGARLGAALRAAYHAHETAGGDPAGPRAGPRGHVRRAHWHGYWIGPRDSPGRRLDLRWLPPIPVALDDPGGLAPVVRPVA